MIKLLIGFVAAAVFCIGSLSTIAPATAKNNLADTLQLDSSTIEVTTVKQGLEVPWEMLWGEDNHIWYTEQNGNINRFNPVSKKNTRLLTIKDIYRKRLGLLSMVLHPELKKHPLVYLNYLVLRDSTVYARIVRYRYEHDTLTQPLLIREWLANDGHNGTRMLISKDKKLMVAVGDIRQDTSAQDTNTPYGKINRFNLDGSIPKDNPYPGSPVWARGFRVPQGLVFSENGNLYAAEHGDATDDELNLIEKGKNYGFPYVLGRCNDSAEIKFCKEKKVQESLISWTPTIAPAGIDYFNNAAIPEWKNSILIVTLKTQSFRVLSLNTEGTAVEKEQVYFANQYGRLRDICVAPNGDIYLSTSNRDWNPQAGFPLPGDDRIIRLRMIARNKARKSVKTTIPANTALTGKQLYTDYCASCHKADGKGVATTFPPVSDNPFVAGDKNKLIQLIISGDTRPRSILGQEYHQPMPAFSFLKDEEIAAVASYIRQEFNGAGGITADEVGIARKSIK